ncbi:MAG: hypothetical protein IJ793_00770 [Opitutales bacterium]|nr:hypothetical protein [Opitutales bacterium]
MEQFLHGDVTKRDFASIVSGIYKEAQERLKAGDESIHIGKKFLLGDKSRYAVYRLPEVYTCAYYYISLRGFEGIHLFLMKDLQHRVSPSDYTLVVYDERERKVERRVIRVLSDIPLICHNLAREILYTNNEIIDIELRAQVLLMIGFGKCKLSEVWIYNLDNKFKALGIYLNKFGEKIGLCPVLILESYPANGVDSFSWHVPCVVGLRKAKQGDKIGFGVCEVWIDGLASYKRKSKFLKGVFDRVFESPSEWMRFLDQNRAQLEERERKFYNENKIAIEDKKEEPQVEEEKGKKPLRKGESPEKIEKNEIIMKEDKDPFGEN